MATKAHSVHVVKGKTNDISKTLPERWGYAPFTTLRDEMDRVFDRFLSEEWMRPAPALRRLREFPLFKHKGVDLSELMETPRADMSENEMEYELTVELPGMSEKDIELNTTEDMISLKGEKKSERETKEKDYRIAERSYGSVLRTFAMPSGVETNKVKANFSKGVLTVHLPKTREARAKPRKVDIKAE
jgi:HSP20 family protein